MTRPASSTFAYGTPSRLNGRDTSFRTRRANNALLQGANTQPLECHLANDQFVQITAGYPLSAATNETLFNIRSSADGNFFKLGFSSGGFFMDIRSNPQGYTNLYLDPTGCRVGWQTTTADTFPVTYTVTYPNRIILSESGTTVDIDTGNFPAGALKAGDWIEVFDSDGSADVTTPINIANSGGKKIYSPYGGFRFTYNGSAWIATQLLGGGLNYFVSQVQLGGGAWLPDDQKISFGNTYSIPDASIEWDTAAATDQLLITSALSQITGKLGINEAAPDAMVEIATNNSALPVLHIKGAAGQSVDLVQITNSSDTALIDVTNVGQIQVWSDSNPIKFGAAGDTDADLVEVNVTDSPKIKWDESADAFSFTKAIRLEDTTRDDIRVTLNAIKVTGANQPTWTAFQPTGTGSLYAWVFGNAGTDEAWFSVQLPHTWDQGTDLLAHVHFAVGTNGAAGEFPVWQLDYTWANIGSSFGAPSTLTADATGASTATTSGDSSLTAWKHYIQELGTISGSGKTLSSMLICRIFRDGSHAQDDYTAGNVFLLEIDFHYEINSLGSNGEYTKPA